MGGRMSAESLFYGLLSKEEYAGFVSNLSEICVGDFAFKSSSLSVSWRLLFPLMRESLAREWKGLKAWRFPEEAVWVFERGERE